MRNLYTILLSLSLFFASSCSNTDEDVAKPSPPLKPSPQGSEKVKIQVDEAYDLSNTHAVSSLDSTSMILKDPTLFVPSSEPSLAFFLDKDTDEVMAVVRTIPNRGELNINAQTVTEGLYDLLPAYHSLTVELKSRFESEVIGTQIYKDFLAIVDNKLKTKSTVYATDPVFFQKVTELNAYIINTYLADFIEGGRTKGNISQIQVDTEIKRWLVKGENAIKNPLVSYVGVNMEAERNLSQTFQLNPRTDPLGTVERNFSSFSDDYYQVRISQKTEDILNKNKEGVTENVIEFAVDQILGGSNSKCHQEINTILVAQTTIGIFQASQSNDIPAIVSGVFYSSAKEIGKAFLENEECGTFLIFKAIASKFLWISKAFDLYFKASDIAELAGYIMAVKYPVELTDKLQIYNGGLVSGRAKVIIGENVNASYSRGEIAKPVIKLIREYAFDEFSLSGFTVDWKIENQNGTIGSAGTLTNPDGLASQNWTMPLNGVKNVTLVAEIKDKSGNHILGSPVTFNTVVECKDPMTMKYWGIGNIVTTTGSNGQYTQNYTLDFSFYDPCNVLNNAKEAYLLEKWSNGVDSKVSKHDLKGFSGKSHIDYSFAGNAQYYWDDVAKNHCCKLNYQFELIIDGKSYGTASAVSP